MGRRQAQGLMLDANGRDAEGREWGTALLYCPTAGELIDSGRTMDRETFDGLAVSDTAFGCPRCGRVHAWNNAPPEFVSLA